MRDEIEFYIDTINHRIIVEMTYRGEYIETEYPLGEAEDLRRRLDEAITELTELVAHARHVEHGKNESYLRGLM